MFEYQEQIDSFPIYYPGCTVLNGSTHTAGQRIKDITNLNGLEVIQKINGSFYIMGVDSLISLHGLQNIDTFPTQLYVIENPRLKNLQGLEGARYASDFVVSRNDSLINLTGLTNLNYVLGRISFSQNDLLNSLTGLENLITVNGYVVIGSNKILTSLSGIDNIDPNFLVNIFIEDNYQLSHCNVQSICDYLSDPQASSNIEYNTSGCNTRYEVETACGIGIDEKSQNEGISIYPNPANDELNLVFDNNELMEGTHIELVNSTGSVVLEQDILQKQTKLNIQNIQPGMYVLKIFRDGEYIFRKVVVQ